MLSRQSSFNIGFDTSGDWFSRLFGFTESEGNVREFLKIQGSEMISTANGRSV